MGHQADRARGLIDPLNKERPLSLVATLLGEEHSKIKPRVDDTLEAMVKASHIRE